MFFCSLGFVSVFKNIGKCSFFLSKAENILINDIGIPPFQTHHIRQQLTKLLPH